ncbi:MAG: type II toxin-antitoxin system HipA family toxin [Candidatus Marinimicrobia bacterium]|nr:type II toxin-antitoxin system HipA family toxin [Candidatus Neomarinimicrobiota bacterium]
MFKPVEKSEVYLGDQIVGRLAITAEMRCAFEYTPQFLATGFAISPFYLPLKPRLFLAAAEPFSGGFGVFNDSLPDGWGNLLLDRLLASRGIDHRSLSLLDRLSLVGGAGMGALEYRPDRSFSNNQSKLDIPTIAAEIEKILAETQYTQNLELLVAVGGSSGGARPKVMLQVDGRSWLVKFPAPQDASDIGEVEYKYSRVAKLCKIIMPETALFEDKYFGVRRFDRVGTNKIHMLTASGLLNASHRYPALDYVDLIKATRILTGNIEDAYRLFRLGVFNVLTGNRDDHAKNFSFLYKDNQWQLAPAYDLVPSPGFGGNHTTTMAGSGQPDRNDMVTVSDQCDLDRKVSQNVIDEVYELSTPIRQIHW